MAGAAVVNMPTTPTAGMDSPRMKGQGSPEKHQHVARRDSGEVKISPQGKGVGVFGLEGSPTINGQVNGLTKDPKVHVKCVH